jgi:hypothetical protein
LLLSPARFQRGGDGHAYPFVKNLDEPASPHASFGIFVNAAPVALLGARGGGPTRVPAHSALFREFWRPSFGVQRKGDGMEYLANPEAFFLTRAGSDEMLRVEA